MKLAFVFPGQGSQSTGMLAQLAEQHPVITTTFAAASEALGYDLWQLVQNGPAEQLNQTHITQPALLTASVACYQLWIEQGGEQPVMMAGHSLGEYSALVCAGSLDFSQAVKLVAKRGEFMQAAVPQGVGAMAAIIGLDDQTIQELCKTASDQSIVSPANFNSKGQVVIAGHKSAVEKVTELAKEAGARMTKILPVSVPSHCALMQPAADQLAKALSSMTIKAPSIPVIHNYDVQSHSDPEQIRTALIAQLHSPVRWVETIEHLLRENISHIVECGPGKVLNGLIKRIHRDFNLAAIQDPDSLAAALGVNNT